MRRAVRRASQVTATDLFCGAGGSSIGVEKAGAKLVMAANHWKRAIETHSTNFPHASHDCADISQVDPRRYPRTDVLIASPECTTHSPARGRRPERTLFDDSPPGLEEVERSRVTMWDVVRFAEHHRYDAVIVENVVEIRRWEPFEAWLSAMFALGYEHRPVYMNSMVAHPTPQSRDRIYIVFWRKGNRAPDLRFDVAAWCARDGDVAGVQSWKRPERPWGKYRTQYVYRCPRCGDIAYPYAYPAASVIDWSLPAPRIGDRARPLADATLRRIRAGLEKYGRPPYLAVMRSGSDRARAAGVDGPLATVVAEGSQFGLVVDTAFSDGRGHVLPSSSPFASQTGQQTKALVVPLRTHGRAAPAELSVLPTVVAGNAGHALLIPAGGTWNDDARPADAPFRARTSSESEGLLVPPGFIVQTANSQANGGLVHSMDEPLRAVTTLPDRGVVQLPAFIVKNYTPRGRDAQMSQPVSDPLGTVTGQDHHSLVTMPFLVDYHGNGGAKGVDEPMGVVDATDRRALVAPAVEVEGCGFRMLEPHEIKGAMAFPREYAVLGNKREQVRQCGNAVTPPVMDAIAGRVIASLYGREV